MNDFFARLQRLVPDFHDPHLPLDSDYSYQARCREDRRLRESRANTVWFRL